MPNPQNSWYAIAKKGDAPDAVEISIYDEIGGWGVTAQQFVSDLKAINAKQINLRLNTPGGEVTDGTAIYNALQEHPARIVVHVDGLAASAGSFIAMSGDEVRMADNAYLMIHNARGGVMGGAEDMRRYADVLEKMNDNIAGMYERKTGVKRDHWRGLMDAETWFTAEEAKEAKLADAVYAAGEQQTATSTAAASRFKAYNKIPDPVRAMWGLTVSAPMPASQPENPAPEDSTTSVEPPPAVQKENAMADTSAVATQAAPAQTPAAGNNTVPQGNPQQTQIARLTDEATQTLIEKGKVVGRAEGRQMLMDEIRAIVATCPGRPQTALNAVLAGQNASTVKLIVDAEINAEAAAAKRAESQEVEIAKLRAEHARLIELSAIGGHPGVPVGSVSVFQPGASAVAASPSGLEPEAQAKLEWDSDPMLRAKNGNNEKAWMLYRVNQLKGHVRVLKTA